MSEQEIDALRQRWEADRSRPLTLELAAAYRRLGQPEAALEVLADGLERHPEHVAGRVAKGRCHLELDQLEEAGRELKRVAIEDPAHLAAHQLLAELHARLGDLDRARDHFDLFGFLGGSRAELAALEDKLERPRAVRPEPPEAPYTEPLEAPHTEPLEAPHTEPLEAPHTESLETPHTEPLEAPHTEPFEVPSPEPREVPGLEPALASPPELSEPAFEPLEPSSPSAAAGSAAPAAGARKGADPDPFVLLDWIEFDEARYAAALVAEGLFSPPGTAAAAVGRASRAPAPAAAGEPAPTLTLAELYRKQGHHREAAGILRQILERQPGHVEAARALAELEKQGSWPLSADDLLGAGAAPRPTGAEGSTADLLRRYRDRLRGRK